MDSPTFVYESVASSSLTSLKCQQNLANLARHFGVDSPTVTQKDILVDPRVQWGEAGNVWHNSAIRTGINLPVRMIRNLFGQGK